MRKLFFLRLAVDGMKKNRQIYLPYLLTCICTVMMFYILQALSYSPLLYLMRGGSSMEFTLTLGKFVVAVFSFLFLWYSNSFLTRRRGKEFGLYNILGMGKRGLRRIMMWESLLVAVIGIFGGMFLGFLLSKMAELCLANILKVEVTDYSIPWSVEAILFTAIIYGFIFGFLLLRSVIRVQISNPLELFRSENVGEKPPKANWVLAVLGLLLLVVAYAMAVSIQSPITALVLFFVAVIMVILATYFLFIAGSVALCKLLKNYKAYYYKKQHFVSVSSMIYRMKRNGAGLASICILCTMVMVMLSSTGSMYFGMTDVIESSFCRQAELSVRFYGDNEIKTLTDGGIKRMEDGINGIFGSLGVIPQNELSYLYVSTEGTLEGEELYGDEYEDDMESVLRAKKYRLVFVIDAEDYNRIMGENLRPKAGEAYLYTSDCTYEGKEFRINGVTWHIREHLKKMFFMGEDAYQYFPAMVFVVSDIKEMQQLLKQSEESGFYMNLEWYYGYDLEESDEVISNTAKAFRERIRNSEVFDFLNTENAGYSFFSNCKPDRMQELTEQYGGLFFIGILLSALFLMAAVLIIYYKQISEGYEDQGRFEIMQKVGMTKKDIKSSINSQVLTVFFAPLLMTGMHLIFAYPMIWKVLQLFMIRNLMYVILVTVAIFVAFTVFYVAVYKWTAGTYYRIVNGGRKGN